MNCVYIFINLKLELLTQFPASNDENVFILMENEHIIN